MANKERGHTDIEIGGKSYRLKPSNDAICEVEDRLNCSIIEIFNRFTSNKPRMKDIRAILSSCCDELTWESAGDLIDEHGMAPFVVPTIQAISNAFGSGDNKKKDEETE